MELYRHLPKAAVKNDSSSNFNKKRVKSQQKLSHNSLLRQYLNNIKKMSTFLEHDQYVLIRPDQFLQYQQSTQFHSIFYALNEGQTIE
jgi:hypothetical protein